MSKGIKKVRKSINERKKTRGLHTGETSSKQTWTSFPQEEEKHGYFPTFSDSPIETSDSNKRISGFAVKGILSVMLFLGVTLLFQSEAELVSKPKGWTSNALTEEFPFASVNQWYKDTFGEPMGLSPDQDSDVGDGQSLALPVIGDVSESFQANGTGIMISPDSAAGVSALRDGVVIFAGNDKETNRTVVVQHADNSKTVYGNLSSVDVHLYQFVDGNQKLGNFTPTAEHSTVYFAIEKDDLFVDPVQVIKVNDFP